MIRCFCQHPSPYGFDLIAGLCMKYKQETKLYTKLGWAIGLQNDYFAFASVLKPEF